jgi:hypothetical protein
VTPAIDRDTSDEGMITRLSEALSQLLKILPFLFRQALVISTFPDDDKVGQIARAPLFFAKATIP